MTKQSQNERDWQKARRFVKDSFKVRDGLSKEQIETWLAHCYVAGLKAARRQARSTKSTA